MISAFTRDNSCTYFIKYIAEKLPCGWDTMLGAFILHPLWHGARNYFAVERLAKTIREIAIVGFERIGKRVSFGLKQITMLNY